MMPKIYFHLYNGSGHVPDTEGQDLPDLKSARERAEHEIRSIIAEEVKEGHVDLRGRIELADEAGELLSVVLFAEAIDIVPGHRRQ